MLKICVALIGLLMPACCCAAEQELPAAVDLSPQFVKFELPARAQGRRDTCSLFAVTALAEYELSRLADKSVPLSEEYLTWAANSACGLQGDQAMFYEAVHGLNALGICAESELPYGSRGKLNQGPRDNVLKSGREQGNRWRVHWIKRWNLTQPLTDEQMLELRQTLADGHPIACGLRWPKSMDGHDILNVPEDNDVFDGHSIAFTGYRDDPAQPGGGVFIFRNSFGADWGKDGYGTMSYAYVRRYANDALWLEPGAPGSEVPVQRIEGEQANVTGRDGCSSSPQNMQGWGGPMWSDGKQLFIQGQPGDSLTLTFDVKEAGTYRLRALGTTAPDFGIIGFDLDGRAVPGAFDLYCGRVAPAGSLELGTYQLAAGPHQLRLRITGKNPGSTGTACGLDAIDLLTDHSKRE